MKSSAGQGTGKWDALSRAPSGIGSGKGRPSLGRKSPAKWQISPPMKTNVSGVVRARPQIWPMQCPGVLRR